MMENNVGDMRKDYTAGSLDESEVEKDPIVQFQHWFTEALKSKVIEPNAMVLATSVGHQPSARVVLLKGFNRDGFVFYTNYDSRKGHELEANPSAALLFFWDTMERQVRIEGEVRKVDAETSDEYFDSRPRGSRIGAIASPQSKKVANREELEQAVQNIEQRYAGDTVIPRPGNWGGYVLAPTKMEFWQGRSSRLHDRVIYERVGDNWDIYRVAP